MTERVHITVRGSVQGVGFRPFVYRLAKELGLSGWVLNSPQGVSIELEGVKSALDAGVVRIGRAAPPRASIQSMEFSFLDPVGYVGFEIRQSNGTGERSTLVLPDIATCADCVSEIFDSADRRYLYPFTNCTNCGPRFTIIEDLPYDRGSTSMKKFTMCAACRSEYDNPLDRRFHAQPNACPQCGPHIELWDPNGRSLAERHEALRGAVQAIQAGRIVAIQGVGGFHLLTDALSDTGVARLRQRKGREEKPFALMAPGIESTKEICRVSELEERLLVSPESPIVLLERKKHRSGFPLSRWVAPRNPYLGVMLPYSPLHHVLMHELGSLVVATSGNLSEEPICTNEREAVGRLRGVADVFLVHDRPIVRHVDDSVVRVMMGRELVLRRARGYAPLPIRLNKTAPRLMAVGAQLKNTVALASGPAVFISQHIGDLASEETYQAFQGVIESLCCLYGITPERIIGDLHPQYLSSQYARESGRSPVEVQHHHAHVASCMAENELEGTVLGVAWDGNGYGLDGTVWGGEFLLSNGGQFERAASLKCFRLPGGEQAVREPRRTALALLFEIFGPSGLHMVLPCCKGMSSVEYRFFDRMLAKGVAAPLTTSVGRLFDGVSSLLGLCQKARFEGQAAMELEFLIDEAFLGDPYPFPLLDCGKTRKPYAPLWIADWSPMVREILHDLNHGVVPGRIAARFHSALVELIVRVAERVQEPRVVLSGGCFQNKVLCELAVHRLREAGFHPYWHQRVPPNDGGIALGQIYAWLQKESHWAPGPGSVALPRSVKRLGDPLCV